MAKWLTSLFFLFVLVASVPAGSLFSENGMNNNFCPMKCCKKKSAKTTEPKKNDVAICRTLNCSVPGPTNTNTSPQTNLAPLIILSEKMTLFEILFSTSPKENVQPIFAGRSRVQSFQPKYIQNQSFLI